MNRTEKKDLEGYSFIRNQIIHAGTVPSLRRIGEAVGYSSPRSVQLMLERLSKRELLSYKGGKIELLRQNAPAMTEQTVKVPLVGRAACGLPTLAEQDIETYLDVSTKIARSGRPYFLLRAQGDSMDKAGINDGDLVLVRQQPTAEEGEIIVALINDSATIKHFHRKSDLVILKPNSSDKTIGPIFLSEEFIIQGVVVQTIPNPF
jgi:repressor LexA